MTIPVAEDDFYDGPEPGNVRPLFREPLGEVWPGRDQEIAPPPVPVPKPKRDHYLAAINAAMDVLSYRLIMLLAVLASAGLFGGTVVSPDPWRLGAASAFSIIVTLPTVWLYSRERAL